MKSLSLMNNINIYTDGNSQCCPKSKGSLAMSTPRPIPTACRSQRDWRLFVDDDVLLLPRSEVSFGLIADDPALSLKLAPKGSLAGAQLKHVYNFVENLVKRESPLVFKIGYTHDPHTRFRNKRYGYSSDSFHKWQSMVILFAGSNSTAAAYIGAATIQKFKGHLVEHVQRMF